ncbi:MAG: ATP-binding cassette domain-containing protein [Armatimonadetes bacterium]|nr:ATP-binding cassette domain-containing protein [Armatimonadota bacterium]
MTPVYELAETLLSVQGVNLALGGKTILRDVSFDIKDIKRPDMQQGQVVGLLGPSGIGKTQLFRIISGLNEPDSGSVCVGVEQKPVARGDVGVVAQNYPLFQHRTVLSNLVIAGRKDGDANEQRAQSLLEQFGLTEHAAKFPAQLSGGQRQRAAIAQQFMCSEHFLLMDEPFSGLDYVALKKVAAFIQDIATHDDLATIILVTHDVAAALAVCDTILLLGRDRDENGDVVPGARIQESYNLIDAGLAWHDEIENSPQFFATLNAIRTRFATL